MVTECLGFFSDRKMRVFFEGTVGAGGHAKAILEAHPEIDTYIGCDRDPEAIAIAKEALEPWKDKVVLVQRNFGDLDEIIQELGIKEVDGFFLT
jgi:16S rRNA (cytosine1402-N4)-methyltransferase